VTAKDTAAHTTTQSFTVIRTLTAVIAKITGPTSTGSFGFYNPATFTFDASQSLNRTSPPVALRYQWGKPDTLSGGAPTLWKAVSTAATYNEALAYTPQRLQREARRRLEQRDRGAERHEHKPLCGRPRRPVQRRAGHVQSAVHAGRLSGSQRPD